MKKIRDADYQAQWTRFTETAKELATVRARKPRTAKAKAAREASLVSLEQELGAAKSELIEIYFPLVKYLAERMVSTLPASVEVADLIRWAPSA